MAGKNTYRSGEWKAVCDVCGREYRSPELRQRWDGLMVCSGDWETRQPQDFVRGVADKVVPAWVRSEPEDSFIHVCDLWSSSPMADYAEADCATVGGNTNIDVARMSIHYPAIAGIAVASRTITGRSRV